MAPPLHCQTEKYFLFPSSRPSEHRETLKVREIFQRLKTECREEATHRALKFSLMCNGLNVSRSAYYQWKKRPPSARHQTREALSI